MCILVVINNKSGRFNAMTIYNKFLRNYFENLTIQPMLFLIDNNDKSLFEIYLKNNIETLQSTQLLIIMGGDGTIQTIVSEILKTNIRFPIAVVPVGSGNGLFKSITYENNKVYSILYSIKIIKDFLNKIYLGDIGNSENSDNTKLITNKIQANSIVVRDNKTNNNVNSFLSISWGFVSDVDICSECIRCIGSLRFDLGAVYYLFKKKFYKGVFKYKNENNETITVKGDFFHFWACNSSWASENTFSSPMSTLNDNYIYISYIKGPINRCKLLSILLKMNNGKYIYNKHVGYIKTKEFSLQIENGKIVIDGELHNTLNSINCKIVNEKISYLC